MKSLSNPRRRTFCTALAASALTPSWPALAQSGAVPAMNLSVDASDLERRLLQVRQTLAVAPGALTLRYARYLPGGHGPFGDVTRLAGLRILAGDRPLAWRRQAGDPFAFDLEVPAGVQALELRFDYLAPLRGSADRISVGSRLLGIEWETVLLYVHGTPVSEQRVRTQLKLPAGWQEVSALRAADGQRAQPDAQGWRHFGEVSVETLVDSPLFAGAHLLRVDLDAPSAARPVTLSVLADTPAALQASEPQIAAHRALLQQLDRQFGARHFRHYDLMLALSDEVGGLGLEHHESSENGLRPDYFSDWDEAIRGRELLPHEFVHSWNGKYRRPADLLTPDYHQVMGTSLLWVYEGLTEYWGHVMTARAGLSTPEQARDRLATVLADLQARAGRQWRPLADTQIDPAIGPGHTRDWPDWQRDSDYYDNGQMLWLEADLLIRTRSGGKRSLDDLGRRFFGGTTQWRRDGSVAPQPYDEAQLLAALNAIEPLDWHRFVHERLDQVDRALDPLADSGWHLVWREQESRYQSHERGWDGDSGTERPYNAAHSLGLRLVASGQITQVCWGSPAFDAGLARGMSVVAVGDLAYSHTRLDDALRANRDGSAPIRLWVKDGERYRSVVLDWRGGVRHPALERLPGTADRLGEVYRPR